MTTNENSCPITIHTGVTWSLILTFREEEGGPVIDVSGYDFVAQVRTRAGDVLLAEMSADQTGAANGEIVLSLSTAQTALLHPQKAKWDVLQVSQSEPETDRQYLFGGDVTIVRTITRPDEVSV